MVVPKVLTGKACREGDVSPRTDDHDKIPFPLRKREQKEEEGTPDDTWEPDAATGNKAYHFFVLLALRNFSHAEFSL